MNFQSASHQLYPDIRIVIDITRQQSTNKQKSKYYIILWITG